MTIILYCPKSKCNGTVPMEKCLFLCPIGRVAKCSAYAKCYLQIKEAEIDPKYIERYGEPHLPVPMSMRKRRKRRAESGV